MNDPPKPHKETLVTRTPLPTILNVTMVILSALRLWVCWHDGQ